MSLDISKLENVRTRGVKKTARCPVCAEAGHDQTRDHLIIQADGRFGCVLYPGDSPSARIHRKRIFALCGCRGIKPLAVRRSFLGRLGRVDETHSASLPLKNSDLGRLGRVFQTHLGTDQPGQLKADQPPEQVNECERGVPDVPNELAVKPQRTLTEAEWAIFARAGAENNPLIIEALTLFDGTIVDPGEK